MESAHALQTAARAHGCQEESEMSKRSESEPNLTRREALKACLVPAGLAAAGWLLACEEQEGGPDGGLGSFDAAANGAGYDAAATPVADGGPAPAVDGGPGGDASVAPSDANTPPGSDAASDASGQGMLDASADASHSAADASADAALDASGANAPWASGGTKSMRGNYPDPFTTGAMGAMCVLYPPQTLGPCYAPMPSTREDISDGMTGLPVRLSFLVVRSDGCTPVPNASIDIWHSGFNGIYSAFETDTICNPSSENVLSQRYCRGVQVTNAQGKAHFSTIFPGWYTGRAIHIHFTVRVNGFEAITSQLYFEDALCDEILAQGEYASRGPRDTSNASDFIFLFGGTPAEVTFSTAKRSDGALHAWKVLSIAT
jgi:protocatechuate 3,4-dioxygenase beta subunit